MLAGMSTNVPTCHRRVLSLAGFNLDRFENKKRWEISPAPALLRLKNLKPRIGKTVQGNRQSVQLLNGRPHLFHLFQKSLDLGNRSICHQLDEFSPIPARPDFSETGIYQLDDFGIVRFRSRPQFVHFDRSFIEDSAGFAGFVCSALNAGVERFCSGSAAFSGPQRPTEHAQAH
jgi:hypothetical protein